MDFQAESVEEVDIPPNLSLELNSMDTSDVPSLPSSNKHSTNFGASNIQVYSDCLSASSSSIESLNMLLEKQRKRQLNHPQHQEFILEPHGIKPQESVKETNEIFLKYDPISKRKVLNTYEIIKELGHGQHGKVKLAKDLLTNQLVAIKIVDRHEKNEQKFFRIRKSNSLTHSDKIKREIAIMKKCHYKHVVKLIEVLDDLKSRKIYLVLEYCARGEVKWCRGDQMETEARGPPLLTFQRTREILRGVVLGLEYLHYQGVIHRDIKPANLLIAEDGTVKISDFGVSLAATGANSFENIESVDELELAKTAGTPAFFAPEICLGNEAFDRYKLKREDLFKGSSISFMIDIWALGVTLYCLLFGMLPFISDYELELFEKIVNDPVTFPTFQQVRANKVSQVSSEEEYHMAIDIVNKLLEKNPMKRITIADIKKHPFVCWDFNHLASTDDEYIDSKLREIKEFQLDKEEQFKQIFISRHELKNAVLGVGKKIRESVFKALPQSLCSPSKGRAPVVDLGKADSEIDPDNCSDSSYIVSEGSILSNLGDINGGARSRSMKVCNQNEEINKDDKNDKICENIETPTLFKKGYSICNDNDNNDNNDNNVNDNSNEKDGKDDEISQSDIFEQELQKFDDKHDPKSVVNLPINSSFASLDSFYIDNYAMSKVEGDNDTGHRDSRIAPSVHARPPQVSTLHNPYHGARNYRGHPGLLRNSSSHLDFFSSGVQSTRNDRIPHKKNGQPQLMSNSESGVYRPNSKLLNAPKSVKAGNSKHEEHGTSHSTHEAIEAGPPAIPLNGGKHDQAKDFKIRKGNFFSSFNGQDEETSNSSESSSDASSYSSCSEIESSESNAESLPFEFAVDSANASVVSMRDVAGLDSVRPFMDTHSASHPSKRDFLEVDRPSKAFTNDYSSDDDDSDNSDELVLSVGSLGHQRRQGSAQSSAHSSRRNTLPYLYQSRESDAKTQGESAWTIAPGSASTITPSNGIFASQRTIDVNADRGMRTFDVASHLSGRMNNISTRSSIGSISDEPAHLGVPGLVSSTKSANSTGSLLLPRASAKPTTQASNVGGLPSKSRRQEHSLDNSRDLLKTVLISSAGCNRRKSVPCIVVDQPGATEGADKIIPEALHGKKEQETKSQSRLPRTAARKPHGFGEPRSKSISIAQLGKETAE